MFLKIILIINLYVLQNTEFILYENIVFLLTENITIFSNDALKLWKESKNWNKPNDYENRKKVNSMKTIHSIEWHWKLFQCQNDNIL